MGLLSTPTAHHTSINSGYRPREFSQAQEQHRQLFGVPI